MYLYTKNSIFYHGDMFRPRKVILRPSEKTDPTVVYVSLHCGIPNASWRAWGLPYKVETCRPEKKYTIFVYK